MCLFYSYLFSMKYKVFQTKVNNCNYRGQVTIIFNIFTIFFSSAYTNNKFDENFLTIRKEIMIDKFFEINYVLNTNHLGFPHSVIP